MSANVIGAMEGWEQFYEVTITRPDGTANQFGPLEADRTLELVRLCLTIDDPHANIVIEPLLDPETLH